MTNPTNGAVFVSATFSEDTVVKEYSFDQQTWNPYKSAVKVESNGPVYFRGKDEAGNVSDINSYTVNNIDKIAPQKPTASSDVTEPTNGIVLVSAEFSEDSVKKEYSLDNLTW